MARFVTDNPCSAKALTITPSGIAISSTGASGTVNTSATVASLERGQSVILSFTGGSAGGFTTNAEYYVIPVASGSFRIAATKADAMNGTYISGASGNASSGTVAPVYKVDGTLYFGTGGTALLRGMDNRDTGLSSFVTHTNIPDGSIYPMMIRDILASGSSVSSLVVWSH